MLSGKDSINWKELVIGAVIGIILSAMFGPYIISFRNDVAVGVSAPGYAAPPLQVIVEEQNVEYPQGTEVPDFDGLPWKEEYRVYQIFVENEGNKAIQDLEVIAPLPGCSVFDNKNGPAAGGDYTVEGIHPTRLHGADPTLVERRVCSKVISTDFLGPGENLAVEFVTTTDFGRCDLLLGVHPRPELSINYRWEVGGSYYEETTFHYENDLEDRYGAFQDRLVNQYDVSGGQINQHYGRKYALYLIERNGSSTGSPQSCGVNL